MRIENFDEKYEKLSDLEKIRVQNSFISQDIRKMTFFMGLLFFAFFGTIFWQGSLLYFAYLSFGLEALLILMFIVGVIYFIGMLIVFNLFKKGLNENLKKIEELLNK